MKMCETGVKVEFEKKAFEQIRQNAPRSSTPTTLRTLRNTTRATPRPACSPARPAHQPQRLRVRIWLGQDYHRFLADTGKYDEQGMMGSGDWYGITTGAVK
mgnify:CR=1 FL=1